MYDLNQMQRSRRAPEGIKREEAHPWSVPYEKKPEGPTWFTVWPKAGRACNYQCQPLGGISRCLGRLVGKAGACDLSRRNSLMRRGDSCKFAKATGVRDGRPVRTR